MMEAVALLAALAVGIAIGFVVGLVACAKRVARSGAVDAEIARLSRSLARMRTLDAVNNPLFRVKVQPEKYRKDLN